jgi:threonyl-tRNA synthetase
MREAEEGKVALRRLGQKDQEFLTLDEVVTMLQNEALAPDLKSAMQ